MPFPNSLDLPQHHTMNKIQDLELNICGMKIYVYDAQPLSPPVHTLVLLHGRKSSRELWLETMREMQGVGHRTVAVNIPSGGSAKLRDKGTFMNALLAALFVTCKPVIVSVSFSSNFVLPLLESDSLRGWVGVSPTTPPLLSVPTLLIYGELDVKARPLCEKILRSKPGNESVTCVMVRGVGKVDHDPVLEHGMWTKELKRFLMDL